MAPKFTYDGPNKLFIISTGVRELDVKVDLYSDWKEEVLLSDNLKYLEAMRGVGGDPISATQDLGATYFMTNGWRIRPEETNHELVLTGNLFTDPSGDAVTVPTVGNFNVTVRMFVSNLVDSSVARLDLTQLLQGVWIDPIGGTSGTAEGVGTPTNPSDNVGDAKIIADRDNLFSYQFRDTISLLEDHERWKFEGISAEQQNTADINGFSVDKSSFLNCVVSGTMTGSIDATQCTLAVITGIDGTFRRCGLSADFSTAASSSVIFHDSYSMVAGDIAPICTVGAGSTFQFRSHVGGLQINGITAGTTGSVDLEGGHIILDSSCTGGTVVVRGAGRFTDNSTGTTVIRIGFFETEDAVTARKILENKHVTDPVTGVETFYDDDSITIFRSGQMYETASTAQTYRGRGAERRERLSS